MRISDWSSDVCSSDLITTAPSVVYNIFMNDGSMKELHNPADMPDPVHIDRIEEPWIDATISVPDEYLRSILKLCQDRRGIQKTLTYVAGRAPLPSEMPHKHVCFDSSAQPHPNRRRSHNSSPQPN